LPPTLSHINGKSSSKVGKYKVDVQSFKSLALPELEGKCDILLIDELGKIESFAEEFIEKMKQVLLKKERLIVGTVALKGNEVIEEMKEVTGVEVISVTKANRDDMSEEVLKKIRSYIAVV